MNRVPQQTVNDIKRLADVCDRASRSGWYAFAKADMVPFLKMVLKGFVPVVLVGLALHAPTWMADRERNPFSWTPNTQILQLLIALYVVTVIVTTIIYIKKSDHDSAFLRYAAVRRTFEALPSARQTAVLNALEVARATDTMPYAELTQRQLVEVLRVARSIRLKWV